MAVKEELIYNWQVIWASAESEILYGKVRMALLGYHNLIMILLRCYTISGPVQLVEAPPQP